MCGDQTCRERAAPRWIRQARDVSAWVELYHNPFTRDQGMRLCGFSSVTRFNERFSRYVAGGYAIRHRLQFFGQCVYTLGPSACPAVAAEVGHDAETVRRQVNVGESPRFLEHALRVVDVKIEILAECRRAGISAAWCSERQARHEYRIRSGGGWRDHVLKPDAYVRLGEGLEAAHCFIEVDCGNRSIPVMERTMVGYVRYAASVFPGTYGAPEFVVLCVVPGRRRIDHLRDAARRAGAPMFRFSTFERFFAGGLLAEAWLAPEGEREVSITRALTRAGSAGTDHEEEQP